MVLLIHSYVYKGRKQGASNPTSRLVIRALGLVGEIAGAWVKTTIFIYVDWKQMIVFYSGIKTQCSKNRATNCGLISLRVGMIDINVLARLLI